MNYKDRVNRWLINLTCSLGVLFCFVAILALVSYAEVQKADTQLLDLELRLNALETNLYGDGGWEGVYCEQVNILNEMKFRQQSLVANGMTTLAERLQSDINIMRVMLGNLQKIDPDITPRSCKKEI